MAIDIAKLTDFSSLAKSSSYSEFCTLSKSYGARETNKNFLFLQNTFLIPE